MKKEISDMKKGLYTKQNQALCNWLKACRKAKGLSIRALAQRLDVHHSKVSRVENGGQMLNLVQYIEWIVALQVNPHDIINELWILEMEEQTRAPIPSWEKTNATECCNVSFPKNTKK